MDRQTLKQSELASDADRLGDEVRLLAGHATFDRNSYTITLCKGVNALSENDTRSGLGCLEQCRGKSPQIVPSLSIGTPIQ